MDHPGLYIEVRDDDKSLISVFHYLPGGELSMVEPKGMPWWSTLISAREGVFIAGSFGGEGSARDMELMVFDSATGELLWSREQVRILEEGERWIKIVQDGEEEYLLLVSGKKADEKNIAQPEKNNRDNFPFRYTEGTRYFETVRRFLEKKNLAVPEKVIDYYEYEGKIVISCFSKGISELNNYLYVFDSAGELMLNQQIGENLKGLSDNTFFIFSGNLIFVTSRNDFFEYSLA